MLEHSLLIHCATVVGNQMAVLTILLGICCLLLEKLRRNDKMDLTTTRLGGSRAGLDPTPEMVHLGYDSTQLCMFNIDRLFCKPVRKLAT